MSVETFQIARANDIAFFMQIFKKAIAVLKMVILKKEKHFIVTK